MDYEKLFPGRFIKSADLDGRDVTLEVRAVRAEEIDGKSKAVLSLQGTKKELVMNRTNAESLKLMFGRDTDAWIGKRVTLYPVSIPDPFNPGQMVNAIRVRGSPDIAEPRSATVQRGKKTIRVSVVPTAVRTKANGKPRRAAPPPPKEPEPPPHNEETGEILEEQAPEMDMGLPGEPEGDIFR